MDTIARTPQQIGIAIQQARRRANLTQAQLADRAGTLQKQISMIEAGHQGVRIDTICNVLAALSLNISLTSATHNQASKIEDIF
jgi:HTH-type transcriptional regulator / antitoxin HipB